MASIFPDIVTGIVVLICGSDQCTSTYSEVTESMLIVARLVVGTAALAISDQQNWCQMPTFCST